MDSKVLILTGYGINCEEETKHAFEKAGATAEIVHINDLIKGYKKLNEYNILAFPGGFSYGDDTGSGNAFANRIRNHLFNEVKSFIENGNLVIGICNGFQILANLGLLPALERNYGNREVALIHNESALYNDRWIDVHFESQSPWLDGIKTISLPIAHGEGKFYADNEIIKKLKEKKLIAGRYVRGEICEHQDLESNPNGSIEDIAAITDETGRVLGLMPHPERAIDFTHLPHWTLLKEQYKREGRHIPDEGPGMQIFNNAVNYIRNMHKNKSNQEDKESRYKEIIETNLNNVLDSGMIPGLGKHKAGKVRDVHFVSEELGSPIIMVASDRVSAFDYILDKSIPFKGMVLNMLSIWALNNTKDIIKNSLLESPHPNVVIQRYCKNIGVECVVRGYVWGSLASSYEKGEKEICGIKLPEKLLRYEKLSEPLFTPTTKTEHDEPMTYKEVEDKIGKDLAKRLKEAAIKLYERGAELAKKSGLLFIDTKYEFGLDENGELTLIDEANTPDSSRYCSIEEYNKFEEIKREMQTGKYKDVSSLLKDKPELKIKEMSKQFVRDVLTEKGFSYGGSGRPPSLTNEDVIELSYRYIKLYELLTQKEFVFPAINVRKELIQSLEKKGYKTRKTIGCVGGGQLLKMIGEAIQKANLPFDVIALDPSNPCPASPYVKKQLVGELRDAEKIKELARESDIITYELEHTNAEALDEIEKNNKPVYPSSKILSIIQDKYRQKEFLRNNNLPVAEFIKINSEKDLENGVNKFGYPSILKACHGSYDGRGNKVINNPAEIKEAYESFRKNGTLMLEKFVRFDKEISVIVARDVKGDIRCYDPGENLHEDNILRRTIAPARVEQKIKNDARELAEKVVSLLNGVGVFCVEMFLDKNRLLINEIAPRVHNSGHHTIEACKTSQFEQHIRAITGMPLGGTELVSPVVMVNILGPKEFSGAYKFDIPSSILNHPDIFIHDYGKSETRPKRKIGHVTFVSENSENFFPEIGVKPA